MPLVAVLRDRYVKGHSLEHDGAHTLDVLELGAALSRAWPTDAHLCTYVLHDARGVAPARQPRVCKDGLARLLVDTRGVLRSSVLLADVDNPEHGPWTDALRAELARVRTLPLLARAGIYTTSHGYRIVQPLDRPLDDMGLYERTLVAWLGELVRAGVPADLGCRDWTRLYRLPHVVRAGRRTAPDVYLEAMADVPPPEPLPPPEPRAHRRRPQPAPEAGQERVASAWPAERLAPVADALRGRHAGRRHELGLGLAGALCELGVPVADVAGIVRELVLTAGWEADHARGADDTVARWCAARATRGLRYLDTHAPTAAAALRLAARRDVATRPVGSSPPRSLDEVLERVGDGVTLVRAPCGSGKTQAAIRVAIARARSPNRYNRRTCIAVPTTALAEQVVASIRARAPELAVARLAGVLSILDPATGKPACTYGEAGALLSRGGQSIPASYCERGGRGRCDYASTCPAYGGVVGPRDASVWVSTHAQLSQLADLAGSTGLLVIDETPALLEHESIVPGAVAHAVELTPRFDANYVDAVAPLLDAALVALERGDDADLLSQPTASILREVPLDLALEVGDLVVPPLRFRDMIATRRSPAYAQALGEASRVMRAVVRAATQADARARIRRAPSGPELALTTASDGVRAALLRQGRTVLLDAQAELASALVERVAGYVPPLVDVAMGPACAVHTTHARLRATRRAWLPHGRLDAARVTEALDVVASWRDTLPVDGRRLALVSYLPVARMLRDRVAAVAPQLDRLGVGADDVAHYGALRGLDRWAEHDALATLGDPYPELGSHDVECAYLGIDAVDERMRQRAVAEREQAWGRLRLVHRTRPAYLLHVGMLAV